MTQVCEQFELHCPGCKSAIVDVRYVPTSDGGTVSIDHALPPCDWWRTKEARQWAVEIVTTAITTHDDASA